MINGILLINKERGITSYDVIRRLKKVLPKGQKIGHAGTLDPFATGLLVILLGKATKSWSEFQLRKKGYEVVAEFGYETDTNDPEGKVVERDENLKQIAQNDIEKMLEKFSGKIKQVPPAFSAKRVRGKRAYDLARQGEKVMLEPKEVKVYEFKVLSYDWPKVTFHIECSSGTYVRKLISDLGRELGTYATSVELDRTYIGEFSVDDSVKSESISSVDITSSLLSL